MITDSLIEYIKNQNNKNISRDLIISKLVNVGWRMEDIEEGFQKADLKILEKKETTNSIEHNKDYIIDPYHEPLDSGLDPLALKIENKKEEILVEPKTEVILPKEDNLKIWIPTTIKPIEENIIEEKIEIPSENILVKPVSTRTIEVFEPELNKPQEKVVPVYPKPFIKEIKLLKDEVEDEIIPTLTPKSNNIKKEETLSSDFSLDYKKEAPKIITEMKEPLSNNFKTKIPDVSNSLSKIAMISSYSQDYMSANRVKEEVSKRRRNTLLKSLIIILIFCIVGGVFFAMVEGYIKIPNINIPFIKKDSRTVLLNSSVKFSTLNSYKVKTTAIVSLPSFANITAGLIGGEAISSNDKESFSYQTEGMVNKENPNSSFLDYDITIDSSIFKNKIKTNFKSDGTNFFIDIPDLSTIFEQDIPPVGVVSISKERLMEISNIFPDNIKEKVSNINLEKLLSTSNSSLLSHEFSSSFKNFAENIEMIKKGEEEINGITTLHYSIETERDSLKNLLISILNIIFINSEEGQLVNIKENIGSVSVNSLEVWFGKKDDYIYKYKVSLTIPLSKVIGLEDKGIANNEVTLDIETTYSDLNIPNDFNTPLSMINFDDFLNSVNDIKVTNTISSFKPLAQIMKNTLGNFGSKSNLTGSCIEPTPGSLFSPLGHAKGASTIVGTIASTMNKIVSQNNGVPLCFSTSKDWAISAPLLSTPNTYFCVDSSGNSIVLNEPLTKSVCK